MLIRNYFITTWNLIDPIYYRFSRLEYILDEEGKRTLIRVRLTKYKGKRVVLADGTIISKNDILLKIHLHNVKLLKRIQGGNKLKQGLFIFRNVRDTLPYIASYIQKHEYANDIKGLIGITNLCKGCTRLGFETESIQNRYYKLFKEVSFLQLNF